MPEQAATPQKIVIPWDLTDAFHPALNHAFETVSPESIHLIHVIRPSTSDGYGVVWDMMRQNRIAEERVREAFLRECQRDQRLKKVRLQIGYGTPGDVVGQFAEEQSADLILLPPAPRSPVRRLLSIPIVDSIIRAAPCPVLVLQDPARQHAREVRKPAAFSRVLSPVGQ